MQCFARAIRYPLDIPAIWFALEQGGFFAILFVCVVAEFLNGKIVFGMIVIFCLNF